MHLFSGGGGGILGDLLLGFHPVCAVEIDPYCQQILSARQKDGYLPWFPIFANVEDFDGKPWRGLVDLLAGGFPCQDISTAGRREGIDGKQSGLWREMARIISEVRPALVWVENSPNLIRLGGARILGDLAGMGYDAVWGIVGAHHAGAPHKRDRIWTLAYTSEDRLQNKIQIKRSFNKEISKRMGHAIGGENSFSSHADKAKTTRQRENCGQIFKKSESKRLGICNSSQWWSTEPRLVRMADGVSNNVDRIKTLGEAQVPAVVALAWEILSAEIVASERG